VKPDGVDVDPWHIRFFSELRSGEYAYGHMDLFTLKSQFLTAQASRSVPPQRWTTSTTSQFARKLVLLVSRQTRRYFLAARRRRDRIVSRSTVARDVDGSDRLLLHEVGEFLPVAAVFLDFWDLRVCE
jgi:hypothetical protein